MEEPTTSPAHPELRPVLVKVCLEVVDIWGFFFSFFGVGKSAVGRAVVVTPLYLLAFSINILKNRTVFLYSIIFRCLL
ncbi:hypothetical protein [Vibrio hibernica]|uniref:hypothetical protein n=1 Tax=Vibrio hibernica TaxID=2587465 RepID=UPI001882E535|nr:hypothetical protein [Vibrio hibernica]